MPLSDQPASTLQEHRYGRVRYLLNRGIDPDVIRAEVMDYVGRKDDAVEVLGLLTALKDMGSATQMTS